MINISLIVEENSKGCGLGQLWLADILGACDQMVLKGTDGTGSKKLELKVFQAGIFLPTFPLFLVLCLI